MVLAVQDSLDKALHPRSVIQIAFLEVGQIGEGLNEGFGKESGADSLWCGVSGAEEFHILDAATGGFGFEDEAFEGFLFQRADFGVYPVLHLLREVLLGLKRLQGRVFHIVEQDNLLSGRAESQLHFRADGQPIHFVAEESLQAWFKLEASIIAHQVAQETGTYANKRFHERVSNWLLPPNLEVA